MAFWTEEDAADSQQKQVGGALLRRRHFARDFKDGGVGALEANPPLFSYVAVLMFPARCRDDAKEWQKVIGGMKEYISSLNPEEVLGGRHDFEHDLQPCKPLDAWTSIPRILSNVHGVREVWEVKSTHLEVAWIR